jgi:hypothetical protein
MVVRGELRSISAIEEGFRMVSVCVVAYIQQGMAIYREKRLN